MKKLFLENMQSLIEAQQASFYNFLQKGVYHELSKLQNPWIDYDTQEFIFLRTNGIKIKGPDKSLQDCRSRRSTYAANIFVECYRSTKTFGMPAAKKIRLHMLLAKIPLMTEEGSFLVGGIERVVVNQIIRSPGVYFKKEYELVKLSKKFSYSATVISNGGHWTKFILSPCGNKRYKFHVELSGSVIKPFVKEGESQEFINSLKNELPISLFLRHFKIGAKEAMDSFKDPSDLIKGDILLGNQKETLFVDGEILEKLKIRLFNKDVGCLSVGEAGRIRANKKLGLNLPKTAEVITGPDLLRILDKLVELKYSEDPSDDIDHLKNKQVKSIGEFIQKIMELSFNSCIGSEHSILGPKEGFYFDCVMASAEEISNSVIDFFKSSELAQFMDQTNPLAENTQKRKITVFGPGGLTRDNVSIKIRDIHPSQYGRFCSVETPEGENAGLVTSIATFSRIDAFGWMNAPYFAIKNKRVLKDKNPIYLDPDQESLLKVAFCDTSLSKNREIRNEHLSTKDGMFFGVLKKNEADLIATAPSQLLSIATSLVPFLEHNDASRILMGSNMQRQSVPLLYPQKAIVGTGLEAIVVLGSGMLIRSYCEGYVNSANSSYIEILDIKRAQNLRYYLHKQARSNQETLKVQKPAVWQGEKVFSGQIIADCASSVDGELSLGRNLTIAYMPWEGYNYEDAIVISERLVIEDCLTSAHIQEHEITFSSIDASLKEDLSFLPELDAQNLDENGIIKIGTYAQSNDILVAHFVESSEPISGERRLELAIKGLGNRDLKDVSFKMPKGCGGRVVDVKATIYSEVDFDDEGNKNRVYFKKFKIFVAQARKIEIGDKLAGRHGNKGVISRILPRQDMPYLPNGKPIDIIFNPLGVPSRMNVGQIFECLLGLAGESLGKRFKIRPFDEIYGLEASRTLSIQKLKQASMIEGKNWIFSELSPGKLLVKDGRTGEFFDNPVIVGKSYILKLIHLVEDKIHGRSIGPYTMITEQPLAGKSSNGGQRFGEMEVWALEAYGSAYTLQELLTIRSDDIIGREGMYEHIVSGGAIEQPMPSIPETFLVLVRELNSLGLDFSAKKIEGDSFFSLTKVKLVNIFESAQANLELKSLNLRKKVERLVLDLK